MSIYKDQRGKEKILTVKGIRNGAQSNWHWKEMCAVVLRRNKHVEVAKTSGKRQTKITSVQNDRIIKCWIRYREKVREKF